MIENFYLNKIKILQRSSEFFYQQINKNSDSYKLKIGCELEFFLLDKNKNKIFNKDKINHFCKAIGGKLEQGCGQIEISTFYTDNLFDLACEIDLLKQKIINLANSNNLLASFAGKPFEDDCGSSLQFNISLHENNDKNIFLNDSKIIDYCATGLLDLTNFMLPILAPHQKDYQRFDVNLNKSLFRNSKYTAPVNLSYGRDNRTCAIRVCESQQNRLARRLEYRVASANCDIWLGLSVVIIALEFGLNQKMTSYPVIYGNAFDDIYNSKKILDFDGAKDFFADKKNNYVVQKLEEILRKI